MKQIFSVIIPTSNRKELLEKVLYSLNYQTIRNFEVVVIDDGSSDGTREMIEHWDAPYNLIYRYIDKISGTGAAGARNKGIELANGEIIIFLDSDSLVPNNFIEEHLRIHSLNPNVVLVSIRWNLLPQIIDKDQIKNNIRKQDLKISQIESQNKMFSYFSENLNQYMIPWWFFSTSNASARKDVIQKIGGFDENFKQFILYEDTELAYRLYKAGVKFILNIKAECFHLYHPINEVEKLEYSKGNIEYFQSKYKDDVEIQSLNLIKANDWISIGKEERGWLSYISAVRRAKGIVSIQTKTNYILLAKNSWNHIEEFLLDLNKQPNAEENRVIVMDLGSKDNLDYHIQMIDVRFHLLYFRLDTNDKQLAYQMGRKKVIRGEVIYKEFIS